MTTHRRRSAAAYPDLSRYYRQDTLAFATFDRRITSSTNLAGTALVSGTELLVALALPKGMVVNQIGFQIATASVTPTNFWYSLRDQEGALLGVTADATNAAQVNGAIHFLALAAAFTTLYEGLHYLGIVSVATTTPVLNGLSPKSNIANAPPKLVAPGNTGQATPGNAPATATLGSSAGLLPYGGVA